MYWLYRPRPLHFSLRRGRGCAAGAVVTLGARRSAGSAGSAGRDNIIGAADWEQPEQHALRRGVRNAHRVPTTGLGGPHDRLIRKARISLAVSSNYGQYLSPIEAGVGRETSIISRQLLSRHLDSNYNSSNSNHALQCEH